MKAIPATSWLRLLMFLAAFSGEPSLGRRCGAARDGALATRITPFLPSGFGIRWNTRHPANGLQSAGERWVLRSVPVGSRRPERAAAYQPALARPARRFAVLASVGPICRVRRREEAASGQLGRRSAGVGRILRHVAHHHRRPPRLAARGRAARSRARHAPAAVFSRREENRRGASAWPAPIC